MSFQTNMYSFDFWESGNDDDFYDFLKLKDGQKYLKR